MNSRTKKNTVLDPTITNLSQAIFTVNRHAKTALDPKFLYNLKKLALKKMIIEKMAVKRGLHFSRNPRFSQQQSDVLVECGEYTFHIPPTKEDFANLPHLGQLDHHSRNPKSRMPLSKAKQLLLDYTGMKDNSNTQANKPQKPVFKKLGESFWN